jgi:NTP pyrophosphatase (non-canonical NTP hydrolase)
MSDFSELRERAKKIRQLYADFEKSQYGRSWTHEEIMLGFVGDVGDLSKLVLANEGVRQIDNAKYKLAHELSDCLWSILVLAELYDVDLETSFLQTMDELEDHLTSQ